MFPFAFKEGGVRVSRKRDSLAKQLIISQSFIAKNQKTVYIFLIIYLNKCGCASFCIHAHTHEDTGVSLLLATHSNTYKLGDSAQVSIGQTSALDALLAL